MFSEVYFKVSVYKQITEVFSWSCLNTLEYGSDRVLQNVTTNLPGDTLAQSR